MSNYNDYETINFLGKIHKIDDSLNKLRLSRAWFNGFYTLIPKDLDLINDGIFIPSLCDLSESTVDLIREVYGAMPFKRIVDRDFLMYIYDEGIHFEGIWLPLIKVCDYFKINSTMFTETKLTLDMMVSLNIIKSADYFTRIMGANDIRFATIEEQQLNIHELVHGDIFKISKTPFLKTTKISNSSIDIKDFKDLKIFDMIVYAARPSRNAGPVNFHVNNTCSRGRYGRVLDFSYEKSDKYYLKMIVKDGKNIPYDELNDMFEGALTLTPRLYTIFGDRLSVIRYCDGRVKNNSMIGNHIMKGFEIYGKEGKPYTYLSPLYLASCADSTIWS